MRLNGLDLNLLVALHALLSERNISRAAEKVVLTQSAMSNSLARLREYFQDEILVRSGHKFILTARAESLITPVRDVLMLIENTIVTPPSFDPSTSRRHFTLLVSDFTTTVLIGPLLKKIYQTAPGVGIKLITLNEVWTPSEMIEQGQADLAIVAGECLADDHPSVALFEERYVCVSWRDGSVDKNMCIDDYLEAGHVVTEFANSRLPSFDNSLFGRMGVRRRNEVTVHNLSAPAELVIGTNRIATMHERLAKHAAKHLPISIWPPPIELAPLTEYAHWNQARSEDPGLKWLIEMCIEVAKTV
jgi:DNA-binding transcriptional LysR family regulator